MKQQIDSLGDKYIIRINAMRKMFGIKKRIPSTACIHEEIILQGAGREQRGIEDRIWQISEEKKQWPKKKGNDNNIIAIEFTIMKRSE